MSFRCLISIADFFYWFEDSAHVRRLDQHLSELLDSPFAPSGFELHASFTNMEEWVKTLSSGAMVLPAPFSSLSPDVQRIILELPDNTLHISPISSLPPGRENWLAENLAAISTETGIREFTTHPDQTTPECWARLLDELNPALTLSIENMDLRKMDFQSLVEIGSLLLDFPRLACTFDLSHWIEQGRSSSDPELLAFLARFDKQISKIHYSVHTSRASFYRSAPGISTSHYLSADSGVHVDNAFFEALSDDMRFIIEGVVPVRSFHALIKEIEIVRSRSALDIAGVA